MTETTRHRMFRWAAISAAVHALIVIATSAIHHLLWGKVSFAWEAGGFLQIMDFPVYWVIERINQSITTVPASWPLGVRGTSVLFDSVLHSVLGGAVYAPLAAIIVLVAHRRRRHRV